MLKRVAQACLFVLMMAAFPLASAQAGPTAMPDNLTVPPQNVVHLKTYATGVQVYVCKATAADPDLFTWVFKAPVAELRNDRGEVIGAHYAGPTWEGDDGSGVVGEVVGRADAPDPRAISWLLLRAKSSHGAGTFTPVTYIQRLATIGGVAPAEGCAPSDADAELAVEYTATYVFYIWRGDVM